MTKGRIPCAPGSGNRGAPTSIGMCRRYRDVPQDVYDGLIFADSLGAYFNTNVRDHFEFEEL